MRLFLTFLTLSAFNVFGQEWFVSNDTIISRLEHEFKLNGIDLTKSSTFVEFNSGSPFVANVVLKTESFSLPLFPTQLNLHFIVRDSVNDHVFDGFIINGFVFVQTKNAFFFNRNELNVQERIKLENAILEKYYPNLQLDSIYFNRVNDKNGNYAGSIELELKTKTRNGCMVNEHYQIVSNNDYSLLQQINNHHEPVFTFYREAAESFQSQHHYRGMEFLMYDLNGNLIHKGVISEYDWR